VLEAVFRKHIRPNRLRVLLTQFLCVSYGLFTNLSPAVGVADRAWKSMKFTSWISTILASVVALGTLTTLTRVPVQTPTPYLSPERAITAGIWTVHFGIDLEGRDSQHRMRNLVQ
jgi:hypothetical protein